VPYLNYKPSAHDDSSQVVGSATLQVTAGLPAR
jgi:hypothetical protein